MLLSGFTFPLIFHLTTAWPSGYLRSRVDRVMVSVVYGETVLVMVGLALFRDPFFDPNCWANCAVNTFLVGSLPPLARLTEATDRWFTLVSAIALVVVCLWRIASDSRPARHVLLPVAMPAIGFTIATAGHAIALQRMLIEDPLNPVFFSTFVLGCATLILLGAGLIWAVFRARAHRNAVGRIVTTLGEAPTPGTLESALGRALSDQDLRIAYWLPELQTYVDANGQPVPEPAVTPIRTITNLVHGDQRIAVVSHAAALPELSREDRRRGAFGTRE